jgi:hypothetical protein
MHPRPIYRWKTFWFGVLFFTFLGWASWHSANSCPVIVGTLGGRGFTILRVDAGSAFAIGMKSTPAFNVSMIPRRWIRDLGAAEKIWRDEGASVLRIPDRLAAACILLAWLGGLVWRWRKMRRYAAAR